VEIKDGRLHVDGRRFVVRGIGYEPGARPGQYPRHRKFEPDLMQKDLDRIRAAGFNTVRCWDGYTDEELALIEKSGLFVIQGIEIDWRGDLGNENHVQRSLKHIDRVVKAGAGHKNVLMYLVMNEPNTETILKAGEPQFLEFLCKLRDRVRAGHPGVPVSFANTCIGEFLDPSIWDAVGFNLYMYNPVAVKEILGYRGYLEWLRKRHPRGAPVVVTEFGLSVSPEGEGRFGYGGNTPQDQVEGILWMHNGLIEAGTDGSCVFSYADGWWKNGNIPKDEQTHEGDAEEWYGLIGYESKTDMTGTERPAFEAMKTANQALWIEPVSWKEYPTTIPVEVYATPEVTAVALDTAAGARIELKRDGDWWRASLPTSGLAPLETLTLTARLAERELPAQKRSVVTDWSKIEPNLRPVEFVLEKVPDPIRAKEPIAVVIRASSPRGGPVAEREFQIGCYPHDGWAPGDSFKARSDKDGRISLNLAAMPRPGVITLSIGTGHEVLKDAPTWGDAFILRVR